MSHVERIRKLKTTAERQEAISDTLLAVNPVDPCKESLAWNVMLMTELREEGVWPPPPR